MPSPPSKDALQPDFEVKRVGMHIGVVVVTSVAQIVGGRQLRAPVTADVEEEERVDDRQLSVALVALHVVVERLAVGSVDVFDALPREYAVVVEVEREISGASKHHSGARFEAISAAHVVVAVYNFEIIAFRAA